MKSILVQFSRCIENFAYNENDWKGTNPLLIPLYLGWDRKVKKQMFLNLLFLLFVMKVCIN